MPRVQPNFIIGGTLPAGTGQLYATLLAHPQIYLPLPMAPECNFFFKTSSYEKGVDHYLDKYFRDVPEEKVAIGERSSLLLSGDWSAGRVREHYPQMKFIFMLRNPVDRAYANYRFTALCGFEDLPFEEALEKEDERLQQEQDPFFKEIAVHSYFKRGIYYKQLEKFYLHFSKQQVLVFRSDELLKNYKPTITRVLEFLGVNTDVDLQQKSDFSSPAVKDPVLQMQLRRKYPLEFDSTVQKIREKLDLSTDCDHEVVENIADSIPKISEKTKTMLTERFAPFNEKLIPMIDFSIKDWF